MENRRNFLKKLLGATTAIAASSLPIIGKESLNENKKNHDEYTIDDLFTQCDGNEDLFYLKNDSWLDKEIKTTIGDKYVDKKYFSFYKPIFVPLPIKEKYTKDDFLPFILTLKEDAQYCYFCDDKYKDANGYGQGILRLLKQEKHGYYTFTVFEARNPKYDVRYVVEPQDKIKTVNNDELKTIVNYITDENKLEQDIIDYINNK